jgi:hypothetical protein
MEMVENMDEMKYRQLLRLTVVFKMVLVRGLYRAPHPDF